MQAARTVPELVGVGAARHQLEAIDNVLDDARQAATSARRFELDVEVVVVLSAGSQSVAVREERGVDQVAVITFPNERSLRATRRGHSSAAVGRGGATAIPSPAAAHGVSASFTPPR